LSTPSSGSSASRRRPRPTRTLRARPPTSGPRRPSTRARCVPAAGKSQPSSRATADLLFFEPRQFYAQRNLYLTGGTLGLALVLARSFSLALELIESNDQLGRLKTASAKSSRSAGSAEQLQLRVAELEQALEKKTKDVETIKSQAATQAAEFDRQGGSVGAGRGADKKLD
jgi:hypothetical protein